MFRFKRVCALALSAVMSFAVIGCGSEKDKADEKAKKVDVSKVETINDAIGLLGSYTKGELNASFDINGNVEGEKLSIYYSTAAEINGDESRTGAYIDMDVSGQKLSLNMPYIVTLKGDRAYIDFDKFVKAFADTETSIGSYGLLAPTIDKSKRAELEKDGREVVNGLVDAFLTGAEVSGSDGSFTASIKDAEGYQKSVTAIVDYVDKNRDAIEGLVKKSGELLDYKDYFNKLIDDMDDDLIDAAKVIGASLTKDQISDFKDQINQTLDSTVETDTEEIWEAFDELKEKLDSLSDDDWKKAFEGIEKSSIDLSVKVAEDSYELGINAELAFGEGNIKLDGSYKFAVKDITIEKPANIKSLKEMAEYLQDNPSVLQSIATGLINYSQSLR